MQIFLIAEMDCQIIPLKETPDKATLTSVSDLDERTTRCNDAQKGGDAYCIYGGELWQKGKFPCTRWVSTHGWTREAVSTTLPIEVAG
jgi:hypothetical protein